MRQSQATIASSLFGAGARARTATRPCSARGLLAQPACVVARRARSWALRGTRGRGRPRSQSVSAAERAEPGPLPAGTPLASNGELHRSTPGTPLFARPIYGDSSWRPEAIELGLLVDE